jgi:hypothetical protein
MLIPSTCKLFTCSQVRPCILPAVHHGQLADSWKTSGEPVPALQQGRSLQAVSLPALVAAEFLSGKSLQQGGNYLLKMPESAGMLQ